MIESPDRNDASLSSRPVSIKSDGSFVTDPFDPGTYVLELIRGANSATAIPVGVTLVSLETSDLSNVTVAVRRDTAITGTFRMESDNPAPVWPSHIHVLADLAVNGMAFLGSRMADGAPGGKFVLRNAFGPRVLRCGYTLAAGSKWWPSHVTLDGVDITNVPTDFSEHENGRLEVVFTQHPARIRGTVTDRPGHPVRAPWILVAAADPALRQHWSSMIYEAQGNSRGEFSIAVTPGRYFVAAFPQERFSSYPGARKNVLPMTTNGVPVQIEAREIKDVNIPIRDR